MFVGFLYTLSKVSNVTHATKRKEVRVRDVGAAFSEGAVRGGVPLPGDQRRRAEPRRGPDRHRPLQGRRGQGLVEGRGRRQAGRLPGQLRQAHHNARQQPTAQ